MSSSFLKKKGEKIKTRQGQKGLIANHRTWGVTDNQNDGSYLLTISSKNLAKERKLLNAKASYVGTQPRLKLL
jgi:hypothetical protein